MFALLDKVAYLAPINDAGKNKFKKVQFEWGKNYLFNCIVYSLRRIMSACAPVPMPKSVKGVIQLSLNLYFLVFNAIICLSKALKNKHALLILACLFHMFSLSAQTPRKDSGAEGLLKIAPLKIGDQIPQELWDLVFNTMYDPSGSQELQLRELKSKKLIILDFWATWCGSCIGSIKKYMASDAYKDNDITFIGVTYQDNAEVSKFNNRFALNFPTIVADKILKKYFPHRILPHIVVLKDNKVLAIAQPEILHQQAMQTLKDGTYGKELVKADILDYDPKKEIAEQGNIAFQKATLARITVLGPIVGLHGITSYKKNEQNQRILITNKSLQLAMYELLDSYWHNRIFLDVKNENQFNYYGQEQELPLNQWLAKYAVGVESVVPLAMRKSEMKKNAMIALLNAKGYDFQMTEREVLCRVIHPTRRNKTKENKGSKLSFSDLVRQLNYQPIDKPRGPIYTIESTIRSQDSVSINEARLQEPGYLLKALAGSGYELKQELRKQPIIQVTERRGL
jgi:thiol-disulfide isomerase/thioredoxin